MASIFVVAAQTTARPQQTEGNQVQARGLRDGSLIFSEWYESLALAGRSVAANMGSVTTPLTFLVTAANRPDGWIRVPSGTSILPLGLTVALEAFAGTVTETDVRVCQNDIGNGTSSAATVGPQSLRGDSLFTSGCTARQLATGDTTAETSPISVWRDSVPTASAAGNDIAGRKDITRAMMGYPILIGPATWEVYIAATTTQATGFLVFKWLEVPTTLIT